MSYRTPIKVVALTVLSTAALLADFQYQETTRVSGGVLAGLGRFAGKALDPVTHTVAVKGNHMSRMTSRTGEIIDLDKETITNIDFDKRTYSVTTFEQMRQAMRDASQRMQDNQTAHREPAPDTSKGEVSFKGSVKETGQSKTVSGVNAHEYIMIMQMIGTDKQSGQSGAMNITNDMWMAPEIRGYQEVRDFQRRMGEKMGRMLGASGFNPTPLMNVNMGKGMAEMAKEMAKLKGTPVLQVMRMGATADGQPLPAASEAPGLSTQNQMPSNGEIAGRAASGAASSAISGQLGRLGGLGGLGGFGKKKPREQPAGDSAAGAAAGGGLLMEMTIESSGFSQAPVDSSKFEVPGGLKQVEAYKDRHPK